MRLGRHVQVAKTLTVVSGIGRIGSTFEAGIRNRGGGVDGNVRSLLTLGDTNANKSNVISRYLQSKELKK